MKKIVFFSLLALLSFDINAKNASEDSITTKNSFVVTAQRKFLVGKF